VLGSESLTTQSDQEGSSCRRSSSRSRWTPLSAPSTTSGPSSRSSRASWRASRRSQHDDTHLHWVAEFGGSRHEWDAEITEQKPDERVAWRNTDGKDNAGVVTFHRLDDDSTRVMVQMDFVPEGIKEKIGDALGAPDRRVQGDLERFKEMIESRGRETGAWRGEVERPVETG
jgi:hypothetical protein